MRAHRTDGVSLVFGVLFLIIALWWAVNELFDFRLARVGWAIPVALIGLGLLGVVGSLRGGRAAQPVSPTATGFPAPTADLGTREPDTGGPDTGLDTGGLDTGGLGAATAAEAGHEGDHRPGGRFEDRPDEYPAG